MIRVAVDEDRCLGDSICVGFCPFSIFEMACRDGRMVATVIDSSRCTACYTCVGQCPADAITLDLVEGSSGDARLR